MTFAHQSSPTRYLYPSMRKPADTSARNETACEGRDVHLRHLRLKGSMGDQRVYAMRKANVGVSKHR